MSPPPDDESSARLFLDTGKHGFDAIVVFFQHYMFGRFCCAFQTAYNRLKRNLRFLPLLTL